MHDHQIPTDYGRFLDSNLPLSPSEVHLFVYSVLTFVLEVRIPTITHDDLNGMPHQQAGSSYEMRIT